MRTLTIFILMISFSRVIYANEIPCHVLKENWYRVYMKSIPIRWDTGTFDCPSAEATVALALYDIHDIKYNPNAQGYTPDFWRYVQARVKVLGWDQACTVIGYRNDSGIYLCPPFLGISREERASTLVHEARHNDPGEPRHAICSGGAYKGEDGGCDGTFHDGQLEGSGFNAEVFFFAWSLQRKDNDLSQESVRALIRAFIPDRFNGVNAEQVRAWRNR